MEQDLIEVDAVSYWEMVKENESFWAKFDQLRELYLYLTQTVPTQWAPIWACSRLAEILDEPHEPWMSSGDL